MVRYLQLPVCLILLPLLTLSCRGCGEPAAGKSLLSLVSADANVVVSTTDLAAGVLAARAFLRAATSSGLPLAEGLEKTLSSQAGFDPFESGDYKSVGIDPRPGLVLFSEGDSTQLLLALRVLDRTKAADWIGATLGRLQGATQSQRKQVNGIEVHIVGRPFGQELVPDVLWTFVQNCVVLALPSAESELVAAATRLQASAPASESSIETEPGYRALSEKLPGQAAVRLYARSGALKGLVGFAPEVGDRAAMLVLRVGAAGLSFDAFVQWPGLKPASSASVTPLASRIGQEAVAVLMTRSFSGESLAALPKATSKNLSKVFARFERETRLDFRNQLAPMLAGPLTASVYLNNPAGAAGMVKRRGRRRSRLLDVFHFTVTADLNNRVRAVALLDAAKAELESKARPFRKLEADRNGKKLTRYEPDQDAPLVGWSLYGDTYVYGAGRGRLDAALDLLDGKRPSLALSGNASSELAKRPGATVAILRLGALGEKAKSVSGGASGLPMMGQLVNTAIQITETLGDFAVSFETDADGLRIFLRQAMNKT